MVDISTKVKNLNIFQRIRLEYNRNKVANDNLTIDELNQLPYYIKNDYTIAAIFANVKQYPDEELRKIDPSIICQIKPNVEFIRGYPIEMQYTLFSNHILSPYLYTEEERISFVKSFIDNGLGEAIQTITWGYAPEFNKRIMSELQNDEDGEEKLDTIINYLDDINLHEMVFNNPTILNKLNPVRKDKHGQDLRNYIGGLLYSNLFQYTVNHLSAIQYIESDEIKNKVVDDLIKAGKYDVCYYLADGRKKQMMQDFFEARRDDDLCAIIKYLSGKQVYTFIVDNCDKEVYNKRRIGRDLIDKTIENMEEKATAEYFGDYAPSEIPYYEEKMQLGNILIKYKKFGSIEFLSDETRKQAELEFQNLSIEEQKEYVKKDKYLLKYLHFDVQSEFIESDFEMFKYCSIDFKKKYIKEHPSEWSKLDEESMIELVAEDERLYNFLPRKSQQRIKGKCKVAGSIEARAAIRLIKSNTNNTKLFTLYKSSEDSLLKSFLNMFDGIESQNEKTIKNLILHSKITSAIGKLSSPKDILHGCGSKCEVIDGIDGYIPEQIEIFQRLNTEQMKSLVEIDSNYVLPYLSGKNIKYLESSEREASYDRATKLFISMFGQEKYEQYKECFDIIYDLQEKNYLIDENDYKISDAFGGIANFDTFRKHTEIPLEQFKLLFNETIMQKCSLEQIEQYFDKLKIGQDVHEEFVDIIKTAYGERASNILESRKQLNVHSINSLEVFDSRILDIYGDAFVHDCISYNLRDFSEFLEIVKNPEMAPLFKNYYDIISGVYGENVETMQRAMSEFCYQKQLLANIKDVDLSDKEAMNLINVLCSDKNLYNIETIEGVQQYDELAKAELQDIILVSAFNDIDGMKERICQNLFGIHYKDSRDRSYGDSLETLMMLYDFSEEESSKEEYSDLERNFMSILNYIKSESDGYKLVQFVQNLGKINDIRNIVAVNETINKVQERELAELNSRLTTIDKLEEACNKEGENGEPLVYKEEIDGVKVYHLNGYEICTFCHDKGEISVEDLLSYEGQGGNTALCSRIVTSRTGYASLDGRFSYGMIPKKSLITINEQDANTQHVAKRTRNYANQSLSVKKVDAIRKPGNEISIYRRERDHSKINNENGGGRIRPIAVWADSSSLKDLAKKYKGTGIAILDFYTGKHKEKKKEISNHLEEI